MKFCFQIGSEQNKDSPKPQRILPPVPQPSTSAYFPTQQSQHEQNFITNNNSPNVQLRGYNNPVSSTNNENEPYKSAQLSGVYLRRNHPEPPTSSIRPTRVIEIVPGKLT